MKQLLTIFLCVATLAVGAATTETVRGTVTFGRGGYNWAFVLLDDGTGARLEFAPGHRAFTGDAVEAAGRVMIREPMFRLNDVAIKKLGTRPLPPRERLTIAELYEPGNDHFALPVEVEAQIMDVSRRRTQLQLYVADLGIRAPTATVSIPLKENARTDAGFQRGATVRVKAVPSMIYEDLTAESDWRTLSRSLTLNVEGIEDVLILVPPPWWTPARVLLAVAFALLVLVAALGWGAAMTAKVHRARIAAEAIAAERRRMAMDLHDTIEQHLAGVKIMLAAALDPECAADAGRKLVERAEDMLVFAKNEVRQAVMDLRGDGAGRPLAEELKAVAAVVEKAGTARCRTQLRGLPERLAQGRQANLLMIVREAVTNAIKHGKANTIAMVADPQEAGFVLRILNDGEPFERATALGPSTGHYGLAGMEERARRGNFALSFGRDGGWTEVRLEVTA